MSVFFNKNKSIIYPCFLTIIYILFIVLTWGKWGHILADSFREALIPQVMLDGKVLYSDITNLYPPLAYQINAFLYQIFGSSLNVLYWSGILTTFSVLAVFYKFIKDNSSDFTAFITVLSVMEIFTFRVNMLNSASWIFPYSYSFLYAFASIIFAFAAYFTYKKKYNVRFLYLSIFFIGLSVAFKYDFLLFGIIPLYEIIKNKSFKMFIKAFSLFLIPTIITFGIYLLNGGTVQALINQVYFLIDFSKAPSVVLFNKWVLAQHINSFVLTCLFFSSVEFAICFGILGVLLYGYYTLLAKINNIFLKMLIGVFLFIVAYIFVFKAIAISQLNHFGNHANFVFLPYFVCISAIVILFSKIKNKNYSEKENFYFLLAICGLPLIYRQIAAISISYIVNFIIIVYWFAFVYFWLELMPEYFSFFNKEKTKAVIGLVFIFFGFSIMLDHSMFANRMVCKIDSDKGTFYARNDYGKTCNEAIKYIKENIPVDKSLVVMDEGLIFNYLTDRTTNLKYYALIPHMVDTYGEDKIVADLQKNSPDFIFVTNNHYPLIGKFGVDYANKIIQFIINNYVMEKTISYYEKETPLVITIFKKR